MAAVYGYGSGLLGSTIGWDMSQDSMQATTNPYAGTYSSGMDQQALSGSAVAMLRREKRERVIQEYIERMKMGQTDGEMYPFPEMRTVSSQQQAPGHTEMWYQHVFQDMLTGKSYKVVVCNQDRLKNQYYGLSKDAFSAMDYKVKLPKDLWRGEAMDERVAYDTNYTEEKIVYANYDGPLKAPNLEPFLWEECTSCKTRHKAEKLDLIGRCSVKLKSHNEKLRKLYWSHKNKK